MLLPDKQLMLPETFEKRSSHQLQRLTSAFEKLKADNPSVDYEASKSSVTLTLQSAVFDVRVDPQRQSIWLSVPIEGTFEYYYDEHNERWIGWADGHLMEELLARSVLSKVQGYLDL
jgi:frataxin-like iron-binding protein CyaY